MAAHSSALAWRSPGTGSLVGCRLWGRTESGTTEVTYQQALSISSFDMRLHVMFVCLEEKLLLALTNI